MKAENAAEKFLKEAFKSNDKKLKLACKLLMWHYKNVDAVEHTLHCITIEYLYIKQNTKKTKEHIAKKTFTNVKALKKQRREYVNYFTYYFNLVCNGKLTEETAIADLSMG